MMWRKWRKRRARGGRGGLRRCCSLGVLDWERPQGSADSALRYSGVGKFMVPARLLKCLTMVFAGLCGVLDATAAQAQHPALPKKAGGAAVTQCGKGGCLGYEELLDADEAQVEGGEQRDPGAHADGDGFHHFFAGHIEHFCRDLGGHFRGASACGGRDGVAYEQGNEEHEEQWECAAELGSFVFPEIGEEGPG